MDSGNGDNGPVDSRTTRTCSNLCKQNYLDGALATLGIAVSSLAVELGTQLLPLAGMVPFSLISFKST